jgi:hypothetical protein
MIVLAIAIAEVAMCQKGYFSKGEKSGTPAALF